MGVPKKGWLMMIMMCVMENPMNFNSFSITHIISSIAVFKYDVLIAVFPPVHISWLYPLVIIFCDTLQAGGPSIGNQRKSPKMKMFHKHRGPTRNRINAYVLTFRLRVCTRMCAHMSSNIITLAC